MNKHAANDLNVNDLHSQLNTTSIKKIITIQKQVDIIDSIKTCQSKQLKFSICGAKGAMGGQQFSQKCLLIDMTAYKQVLEFNSTLGTITVQSGINWTDLVEYICKSNQTHGSCWGIKQKQTGADLMTIGGSLSANAHGRGLNFTPLIDDIIHFNLIDENGVVQKCNRKDNCQLFSLAIGGYGLFGVISEVTLQLVKRVPVKRSVKILESENLISNFEQRINEGYTYGDFQFSCDENSSDFIKKGVFSCYKPVEHEQVNKTHSKGELTKLSASDWRELIFLAHKYKSEAFKIYSNFYLSTHQQIYWSDTHQMSTYLTNYHSEVDKRLKCKTKCSEMISELYVPKQSLEKFLALCRRDFIVNDVNIIYGTIRLIKKDKTSYLAWAKEDFACVIFNMHLEHSSEGITKGQRDTQRLIDLALEFNGSFYLTYHKWANKSQVLRAYPQFIKFLKEKIKHDKNEIFFSDWYRHYKKLFKMELNND